MFKWFSLVGILITVTAQPHPIFVSVTEIEHNAKEKTVEISCKIYTDDFEKTLRMHHKEKIDLLNASQKSVMNPIVADYVKKHLQVSINGQLAMLQFIGFEQQEEAIVSFYQINNISTVKKIAITDNLLYEYKEQQMGIIHAMVNGQRKSTKLNNPEAEASFDF